jgi:hypothetical protein
MRSPLQRLVNALSLTVGVALAIATPVRAALSIRVVESSEILDRSSWIEGELGRLRFRSLDGHEIELSLDGHGLEISNPAFDGTFHPVPDEVVSTAVAELALPLEAKLEAVLYCLPGLPVTHMKSFCVGREIFLAPSLASPPIEVTVATIVHEFGHAFENQRMGSYDGPRWSHYRRLRGIEDRATFATYAEHRNRPAEILAEDFRTLFGGPLATYSGTQENPALPLAESVPGLRELLTIALVHPAPPKRSLRVSNHPNPFNPRTTIVVELPGRAPHEESLVRARVVDLRGRLFRDFAVAGSGSRAEWEWDGTDRAGRRVGSGRYLLRVWVGGDTAAGSMLLIE